MHVVAGTFPTRAAAQSALSDLGKYGITRSETIIIEASDQKGYDREHLLNRAAILRGALVGVIFGLVVGAVLLAISGVHPVLTWRPLALYAGGVAIATAAAAAISVFWNMGASHDEALLFEEVRRTGSVIAAIEVVDPIEDAVTRALRNHGAANVRCGKWRARNWRHSWPSYTSPTHHFHG